MHEDREHNRRSWDALFGVPLDQVLPEMTTEALQAMLAILRQAQARKQRDAQND